MCYSYGDHEAREEARDRAARERAERERREEQAREQDEWRAPERDRELVRA